MVLIEKNEKVLREFIKYRPKWALKRKSGVQMHTADFVFRLFLLPVVPDILHIIVILHDVDELE